MGNFHALEVVVVVARQNFNCMKIQIIKFSGLTANLFFYCE